MNTKILLDGANVEFFFSWNEETEQTPTTVQMNKLSLQACGWKCMTFFSTLVALVAIVAMLVISLKKVRKCQWYVEQVAAKKSKTWCVLMNFQMSTNNRRPGWVDKIKIIDSIIEFLAIPSASSCKNLRNKGYVGTGLYRIGLGPRRLSEMACDINS